MVFSSELFIFFFLSLVLAFYYIVPKKFKNLTLLIFSLFLFYSWDKPYYSLIMLFSIAINYFSGLAIGKCRERGNKKLSKFTLIVSVALSLFVLCFFKYTDMVLNTANRLFSLDIPLLELALPIGISFYTFQTMSYTIDVYRGNVAEQKNFIDFGAYVTMFPQLIAGPIVRYVTVEKQLQTRTHSYLKFYNGIKRFCFGLAKKVIIANTLGGVFDEISAMESMPMLTAWLGAICFSLQIYYDFSGYSDMAIGLGYMFGFNFPENFDHPYTSKSITEFWRRWHITLGVWFMEYLYIPLGGNRKGTLRLILNLLIVWALTGLWHGSYWNYLLWGVYFGVLLIFEKLFFLKFLNKCPKFVAHAYTLILVLISWVIFANEDFAVLLNYFKCMFSGTLIDENTVYLLLSNAVVLVLASVFSTNIYKKITTKVKSLNQGPKTAVLTAFRVSLILLFVVSVAFMVGGTYNPFLYFRF